MRSCCAAVRRSPLPGEAQFTVRVMDTFASALAFDPSLALLSVKAYTVTVYEPGGVPLGGGGVVLLPPPQPAITITARSNDTSSAEP